MAKKKENKKQRRRNSQSQNRPAGGSLFDDIRQQLDDPQADELIAALQHAADMSGADDEAGILAAAFDLLTSESGLREMTRGSDQFAGDLERAKELLYQLGDTDDPADQIKLAHQALQISPDCADAWSILAETATSELEALEMYEKAIEAGRREIGDSFDELRGDFWGFLETRPFMRALRGKAVLHDARREHDQAIALYRTMLDLNPNDNQGVRWSLLGLLLLIEQHDDAKALIDEYSDDAFALWPYGRLLLAIANGCPDEQLQLLLKQAHGTNEHVLAFLLGDRFPPDELPDYFSYGGESEALSILPWLLPAWKTTPGAAAWLRKAAYDLRLHSEPDDTDLPKRRSRQLVQAQAVPRDEEAVWQVDYRKVTVDDEHFWSLLAVDQQSGDVRHEQTQEDKPKPAEVFDFILAAILTSEPSQIRPGEVLFAKKSLAKSLLRRLEKLAIAVDVAELVELERFGDFIENMTRRNLDDLDTQPIDVPVTPGMAWQVGAIQLSQALEVDGERLRPWAVMVVEQETGKALQVDADTEAPTLDRLCGLIHKTIFVSPLGQAVKPEVVYVRSHDEWLHMKETLADWGIQCKVADSMAAFEAAGQHLQSYLGPNIPALTDVSDITTDDLAQFYASAAEFYRAAPWVKTRPDAVFQIRSSTRTAPLFATVMGHMGTLFGLAVYPDLEQLRQVYEVSGNDDRRASWSVMFGEQNEIAAADSDAIDIHGWPIAAPEAFPLFAKVVGESLVPVSDRCEVQSMSDCLSALAMAEYPIVGSQQLQLVRAGKENVELEIESLEL